MNTTERRRLRSLATFLLTVNPEQFDMNIFSSNKYSTPGRAKQHLNDCGTSACALGWAGYLFPRLSAKAYTFECLANELFGISLSTGDWDFLFGCSWAELDNSPEFAARRISLYLEKGLPSIWYYYKPESEWKWS